MDELWVVMGELWVSYGDYAQTHHMPPKTIMKAVLKDSIKENIPMGWELVPRQVSGLNPRDGRLWLYLEPV